MPKYTDSFGDEHLFVKCSCSHPEHQLHIHYNRWNYPESELEDEEMSISIFLQEKPFFKRLVAGVKYIFGYKSKYGHFGEICIDKETAKEIKEFMEKYK